MTRGRESQTDEPRPRWKFGEEIGQRAKLPAKKNSKRMISRRQREKGIESNVNDKPHQKAIA
jgi:hypothetical protein